MDSEKKRNFARTITNKVYAKEEKRISIRSTSDADEG